MTDVGIAGLGSYIPETHHSAEEIAEATGRPEWVVRDKMGLDRKRVPGDPVEEGTIAMGVKAARAALEDAAIDAGDLDLVLWAGEEYRERPMQIACIKVQKDLGIQDAWGFDMSVRCGTVIAALKVARVLMEADDDLGKALIASGYRNHDLVDYTNPRTGFLYSLAAGGAAVVLDGELGANRVLQAAIRTDGSMSDDVYVPAGGCVEPVPLSEEAIAEGRHKLDVVDPDHMKERLEDVSMDQFVGVVEESLDKSGYGVADVDYLAILHMKRSAHDHVLKELGLDDDQAIYLSEYGHMGQNDPVVSLELALEDGRVVDGDVVVMVAAGIGYVWDAVTLEWG